MTTPESANSPKSAASEKLVEVYKARDEWEGALLAGYLRSSGIAASFQGNPSVNLDVAHMLKSTDDAFGIFVIEHDAPRARTLITEFMTAATDETLLEEAAAQKLKVDKETIARLRGALQEERRTFEFLGWIGMVFLGAAALLWMIWPAWLKMEVPATGLRWVMVVLLAAGALFAGSWAGKKL